MSAQEASQARAARSQQPGPSRAGSDWSPTAGGSRAPAAGASAPHYAARRQSSNDSACSSQATPEHCDLHCKVRLPSFSLRSRYRPPARAAKPRRVGGAATWQLRLPAGYLLL